jgi:hypothetical protein
MGKRMSIFRRKGPHRKQAAPKPISKEHTKRVQELEGVMVRDMASRLYRDTRQLKIIRKGVKRDSETFDFGERAEDHQQFMRAAKILNLEQLRNGVRFLGAFGLNNKKPARTMKGYELNLNPFKKQAWKALKDYYWKAPGEADPDIAYFVCVFLPIVLPWRTIVLPLSIGGRLLARGWRYHHLQKQIKGLKEQAKKAEKSGKTLPLAVFVAHLKSKRDFKKMALPEEDKKKKKAA